VRLAAATASGLTDTEVMPIRTRCSAQAAKLVAAEVCCAIHDGPRCECGRDASDRSDHRVDQVALFAMRDEVTRVTAGQRLGEHELRAQQADSVNRLCRNGFRGFRHCHVDVDLVAVVSAIGSAGPLRSATDTVGAASSTIPDRTRPWVPSTVTVVPSCRSLVAVRVPTTQGTPNSRATIAA
jgi:hypothetical protein